VREACFAIARWKFDLYGRHLYQISTAQNSSNAKRLILRDVPPYPEIINDSIG
jgi:hypothetical protein